MNEDFKLESHGFLMQSLNRFVAYINRETKESFNSAKNAMVTILSQLRGTSETKFDINTIPGSYFAFSHPEIQYSDIECFFKFAIDSPEYINFQEKLTAYFIAQLAAYDFTFYVENLVPIFLAQNDQTILHLYITVCRIICDPTTGFLRNAPLSPKNLKNNNWNNIKKFDFFSPNSPDLNTAFGKSLKILRATILDLIKDIVKDPYPQIKTTKLPTIFVPSFMLSVQTIIVPPNFRKFNLACGFPSRVEILLAISVFQDKTQFRKTQKKYADSDQTVVTPWATYYENITGFKSLRIMKPMEFMPSEDTSHNILIRLLKLSLLTCNIPDDLPFQRLGDFVMCNILGSDSQLMPFMIPWCQAIISLYPPIASDILKSICKVCDNFVVLSSQQHYTFFHSIARFLDIYVCSSNRELGDEQMLTIVVYSIIGLCSVHATVRNAAKKVLTSVGRFNQNEDRIMFDEFITLNKKPMIQHFLSYLDRQPASILKKKPQKPYQLLTFEVLMNSDNHTLWQILLASIATVAANQYSPSLIEKISTKLLNFIISCGHDIINDFSVNIIVINVLTILISFTQASDKDEITHYTQIFKFILSNPIPLKTITPPPILLILLGLSSTCFSPLLKMLIDVSAENFDLVGLIISSIAWNKDFDKTAQSSEFIYLFSLAFSKYSNLLSKKNLISFTISDQITLQPKIKMRYIQQIRDFLTSSYKLFCTIESKHSQADFSPFPCKSFVVNTLSEDIINIQQYFEPIYNLCNSDTTVQPYAVHSLSKWFACSKYKDERIICKEDFLTNILKFYEEDPTLFTGLLEHHFEVLFPTYLLHALRPKTGDPFFAAICDFFKPPLQNTIMEPSAMLLYTWKSCRFLTKGLMLKYFQVIYENWGTFILVCIHYMARPEKALTDSAFIALASLAPVIYLFRMKGRTDALKKVFETFLRPCKQFSKTLSLIDDSAIMKISKSMRDLFPFCLEQVLYELLDSIRTYPQYTYSTLKYFIPWFHLVSFDYQNRVISKETELRFMRFSCFSFIDKIFSAVSHLASDNPNAANNDIWRAICLHTSSEDGKKLVKQNDNISGIIYSIIDFTDPAVHVLRYLYTISDEKVLDYVCSFLSFGYTFSQMYQSNQNSGFNSLFDTLSEDSSTQFNYKEEDVTFTPLAVLNLLAKDAIKPFFKYLPCILSFCIIFKDKYSDQTTELVKTIFTEIKPFLTQQALLVADDILNRFPLLPSKEDLQIHEENGIIQPNALFRKLPEGTTNWRHISILFNKFFTHFKPEFKVEYSLECLRWGLCYGDLIHAAIALKCFQGAIEIYDSTVVGLAARALSSVSRALEFLINEKHDTSLPSMECVNYIRTMLKTLKQIAQKQYETKLLITDSAIFWIGMDVLKCNTTLLTPIFDAATNLLEFFFEKPFLFECLSAPQLYNGTQFTQNTFWKFHKPWGDRYAGCYKDFLGFNGQFNEPERFFQFLNLIVQMKCPSLFSDSKNWYYTALLSLLPWMWSVVITDISRFLIKTPKVLMMKKTTQVLCESIEDEDVRESVQHIFLQNQQDSDNDMYTMVTDLVTRILQLIDQNDIPVICNFYANLLPSGPKSLTVPLYAISTSLLLHAPHDTDIAHALYRFSSIADLQDQSDPYIELYKEALGNVVRVERQVSIFIPFPSLVLFDRIVAVLTPNLYEVGPPDGIPISFHSLQSFPQLLPSIMELNEKEEFHQMNLNFSKLQILPFCQINEMCSKMRNSVIDIEALKVMRETEKVSKINIGEIITEVLNNMNTQSLESRRQSADHLTNIKETESYPYIEYNDGDNPEEKETDEHKTQENKNELDSLELVSIDPKMFIPNVADVNIVGEELFYYNEEEEFQ